MKPFQIILLAVFIILGVAAVIVFALSGNSSKNATISATVWGPFSENSFQILVSDINSKGDNVRITYEQHNPDKIDQELLNALAEGRGPDLIIFPDDKLLKYRSKLYPIPYNIISQRDFIDTYIDGATIFLGQQGINAVPIVVDPLVMYWNKAMFNSAAISLPPVYWTDLPAIAPKLLKKNDTGGVDRALVSMGEYRNVKNAKDILTTLFFQSSNPISAIRKDSDTVDYVIDQRNNFFGDATPAVDFYAGFSNPANTIYTWNRSEANSDVAFSAGDLALYFGKASEVPAIRAKNPNLNFDIAPMLQDKNSQTRAVKGTFYSMAILKNSTNISNAFKVLQYVTSPGSEQFWSKTLGMAPARRDLLSTVPSDADQAVFYRSAVQAKTWFDPDPVASNGIFQDMIESVTTGKLHSNEVLSTLSSRLQNLYFNK